MADVVAKFSLNNRNINANFDLNEGNAVDAIFKIDAAGTTWGSIDGDIANQTDLYNILNTKANQSELDSLSETVSNNYTALENEINGLSTVVDNNYSETVERFENDELAVSNLTNTVSNNYTELDNKILTNSTHITSISDTINSFGDIVTYNASNFATSTQGTLADTALQPNDNISELVNNVGYITSASLPVVNNGALTIRANGETVGTFTANQAGDTTVEISIPDSATWGNITGNIQNQTDLVNALNNKQDNLTVQDGITLDNNIISGKPLEDAIGDIDELIPVQATVQNQLADKNFVNSSIATNTANFIGTFNSVAELEAYSGTLTNNDYAFVSTTDSAGNTLYDRYKWNGSEWLFEYELNNSSFTAAQWASINSGITSGDVSLISTAIQPNDNISELTNDAGYITSASLPTVNNSNITLQKNGIDVGSFTLNQSSNSTINFSIPTDTSDLTNNAGFITASSIPTVDQTYDGTSTNAQSGKAINGAKFIRNTASQSTSLAIKGSAGAGDCVVIGDSASSSYNENLCTVIGSNASSTQWGGTALGFYATVNGQQGISLGSSSTASATKAIQIGGGTNKTANTLQIGFGTSTTNYQLLDGTTGLIPDARISSNIARTSQIPSAVTESTVSGWGFTKNVGTVTSVNGVLPNAQGNVTLSIPSAVTESTVAGWGFTKNEGTVKSVNGNQPDGSGNVAITIPTANNGMLTITQDGNTLGTFGANQSANTTIDIPTSGSSRNIGEIVSSTLPLTDAGLHLLDGTLLQYGIYKEFIDYIADLYNDTKVYNPSAFTVVGSPTITDDGIASGFNNNNNVQLNNSIQIGASSNFKVEFQFTVGNTWVENWIFAAATANNFCLWLGKNNLDVYMNNVHIGNLNNGFAQNGSYKGYLKREGRIYTIYCENLKTHTSTTQTATATEDYSFSGALWIGKSGNNRDWSTDLKQFSITVDGVEVFSGSNPANYFTTESAWQSSVSTYGSCGKFVYDSVSKTVRLPKVSDILQSTTDINALGNLIEAGLPNITGEIGHGVTDGYGNTDNGFITASLYSANNRATGGAGFRVENWGFDASRSSTLYGNSTTVQPQTIKAFVYIVIANSTKTSIQVDIDEIATDLNNKAGTDLANVTDSAKVMMAGMGMPSNRYIDLTLGASGSTYTAPANGWIKLAKMANGDRQYLGLLINNVITFNIVGWSGMETAFICPVLKGDIFKVQYSYSGSTNIFRFYYAQGAESEAN